MQVNSSRVNPMKPGPEGVNPVIDLQEKNAITIRGKHRLDLEP
jgi:hypothetical protein